MKLILSSVLIPLLLILLVACQENRTPQVAVVECGCVAPFLAFRGKDSNWLWVDQEGRGLEFSNECKRTFLQYEERN